MTDDSKSYADNYKILEEISKKLQQGDNTPVMIDDLAVNLEEASKAYNICNQRIQDSMKFIEEFQKNVQQNQDSDKPS